jgi:hypothetical protein
MHLKGELSRRLVRPKKPPYRQPGAPGRARAPATRIPGTNQALRQNLPSNQKTKRPALQAFSYGRYWARTSDPQLVELVLSQLS